MDSFDLAELSAIPTNPSLRHIGPDGHKSPWPYQMDSLMS